MCGLSEGQSKPLHWGGGQKVALLFKRCLSVFGLSTSYTLILRTINTPSFKANNTVEQSFQLPASHERNCKSVIPSFRHARLTYVMSPPQADRSNPPTSTSNLSRPFDRDLRAAVLDRTLFDADDPNVKHDIIQTVIQYLQDEGYNWSAMVVQDEANVKAKNIASKRSQLRRMKRAILDGDWPEVERLLSRTTFRNMTAFKYAVYRQQFLELIEAQETHNAFSIMQNRLKELEAYARTPEEFRDLCYLLTCKSVAEAHSFRDWDGVVASRTALVEQYGRLLEFDSYAASAAATAAGPSSPAERDVPPGRLVSLLQQALAFQIASSKHVPAATPRISTLLRDFEGVVVPNARKARYIGHEAAVKAVTFIGNEGMVLASGASDNSIRIWDTGSAQCLAVLQGHRSRVWDVSATPNGSHLASASGDGIVRLWDTRAVVAEATDDDTDDHYNGEDNNADRLSDVPCVATFEDHDKDVYTVRFHARGNAIVSAGYDRRIRLYDAETRTVLKTLDGHRSAVSSVALNTRGNLIISGSKDNTIKFWDVMSGLCVRTISSHLGEVTSVEASSSGTLLLSSSKDNSNRMWDIRMSKAVARFKGHQNTSKNFVRASFGPRESVVIGGSEDGFVYLWDAATTNLLAKLGPAEGPVYRAEWNARQSLLASCSHDAIVSTWLYNERTETQ